MKKSYWIFLAAAAAAVLAAAALLRSSLPNFNCAATGPKGDLSSVRSAIQVYYGDNEGWFPADDLSCLTRNAKYLSEIPLLWPDDGNKYPHPPTREVATYSAGQEIRDTGKWAYFNDPADKAAWGNFVVDCTHEDIKGAKDPNLHTPWSTF